MTYSCVFGGQGVNVFDQARLWSRKSEILITLALFLGALGLYSLEWFYVLEWGGVSTVGAERVLRGEIPYRDFWTMYAPGQFYLLALLFKIFGTHLLVEVVAASVVCAVAACLCYRLVLNLIGGQLAGLACAGIFLAATYNTGYFRRLGSYPLAILLILVALNLLVLHYRTGRLTPLIAAGLATGGVVVCKHDVGGYTAITIVTGLIAQHLLVPSVRTIRPHSLFVRLAAYSAGVATITLPLVIHFGMLAGPDMIQDLITFPLTDFRFARPESYPSLLPFWSYDRSLLRNLDNLFGYVFFTVPFVLFLLGVVAIGLAVQRRSPILVATGVVFSVGYLLHYVAAHIQVNTHIITMSVYAACLGAVLYGLVEEKMLSRRPILIRAIGLALTIGWLLALAAKPAYLLLDIWKWQTVELRLAKVSGFKAPQAVARSLVELSAFVDSHIPSDQGLFVGLHRHDVVVTGDVMIYFILDRPNATRYQELHPAITDTAIIQREIIQDLQAKKLSFLILKDIFSDDTLEWVKQDFLRNLPQIGATQLDEFIRANFTQIAKFGPYAVWGRMDGVVRVAEAPSAGSALHTAVTKNAAYSATSLSGRE